ncbi:hypothetical protein VF14_05410 [Nostoc linckia z18]|uniref:Uncharacterized protein n=3 Tax=Nostoc TaxID=1177 RepID=A0A9Q5ZFI4_NOSLI|nr:MULTISPECIES: hypothetical protein [Nostoc]MBL1198178.1 hypothetical protein [Nostoc sp. GBBB01]MDZ8011515.1 hypothetical protein [Nostoc sp. ZfuVER08]PHK41928.1 hypothetical protein VF12_04795 [Nostoc linckia z15]PHK46661.1 hypothetical protein VF13_09510 [Nostoc linckia z16]MBC1236040.1 hypothetical protein [Nostoc sp. 2RC]
MKVIVYSKYFNFKNPLDKPKIETFVVDVPQIPQVGETIVVERISPQKQFVIIFEYIVTAVQFNASKESADSADAQVSAFLNHCWEGTSNFKITKFLEK